MSRAPDVGDIVIVDFDPQAGHEQAGKRPALVLSPAQFNKITGFAWLCPVTNQQKGYPFEVKVQGTKRTKGVILTDQLKALDWSARNLHKVDKVNAGCLTEVKSLVSTILDI
ncbi:endoribonuclease MazF [Lacimicrobium alkaliphilum]|uniref:mRNA-degrading endonuclease n=1 Tax=Lacimicrobium alkaliphilum TaxID=1526571 RepID=A0A0U2ZIM6_9ALTE|nr:endoribonuclease MazF [Lacimicrobium alkaliphilum]ALS98839.1 mRNA-degrading endonuclease [Lacimicrobium alkaliphilum]